jgi:hypothetical protein
MNSRQRKAIQAATQLVGLPRSVRAYAAGRANFRWTTGAIATVCIFGVLFIGLALLAGRILLPGGLLLVYLSRAVRPPRGVAVVDNSLVVFALSFWNGRPRRVMQELPISMLRQLTGPNAKVVRLEAGDEVIRLSRRRFDLLQSAAGSPSQLVF